MFCEASYIMPSDAVKLCTPRKTGELLKLLRKNRPLVHCVTNEVVQEITANVLLASGASPAMVVGEGETEFFAGIASALSVNVGTPYNARVDAMRRAIKGATEANKPWVLDPVAAGGMTWRDSLIFELLSMHPTAVRGNASEIRFLSGAGKGGKGVDSTDDSSTAIEAAMELAKKYQTYVVVTGVEDYATDGTRVLSSVGGSSMMTLVVGTGCSLSSLMAAFLGGAERSLESCIACCDYVNRANEIASTKAAGPGSFHTEYLDALFNIQPGDFFE